MKLLLMMELIQVLLLQLFSVYAASYQVFYVLPDNSTNASCSTQSCATLSQYYSDNNGSLPVLSNVEYHFLLGEYHINEQVKFHGLYNFTMTGHQTYTTFVGNFQSYLRITNL